MYKHQVSIRQLGMPRYAIPEPSFHLRRYKRPLIYRLRPFTWFLIILFILAMVGTAISLVYRGMLQYDGDRALSAWSAAPTAAPPSVAVASEYTATIAPEVEVTSTVDAQVPAFIPTAEPTQTLTVVSETVRFTITPTPTYDISSAPWRGQLVLQPDNSLQAPEEVQARIRKELGEFYDLLRDLTFVDYSAKRDAILNTYFTGTALKQMQRLEAKRTEYLMNRAGSITIQVRDFSADGYAATVGIRATGWVNDVYDASTGKLAVKDRLEKDTFTIVRVIFERVSNRWKFAAVKMVTEVNKP